MAENLWRCPECEKVVDYGDTRPSDGRTMCDTTGKRVQMCRVREKEYRRRKSDG